MQSFPVPWAVDLGTFASTCIGERLGSPDEEAGDAEFVALELLLKLEQRAPGLEPIENTADWLPLSVPYRDECGLWRPGPSGAEQWLP